MSPRDSPRTTTATPRSLGYAMPAEWEPHEATWLAWPHDPVTWPQRVAQVEDVYVRLIEALSPGERVRLLVRDGTEEERVRQRLRDRRVDHVDFLRVPTADAWIRDYGPLFLRRELDGRRETAYCDWGFNAWGNKYEGHKADDDIPRRLQPHIQRPLFEPGIVLEGGSIDVNGEGALLTTEQCLLHPTRNPQLARPDIERALCDYLGVEKILWLKNGIEGDDTDGHVDDIARFVDPHTILCAVEPDPSDPNHAVLHENRQRLSTMTDARGRPFRIVELPMPGRVEGEDGRLPASYANFYIGNRVVLLPTFEDANDARAQQILQGLFPTRKVLPIPAEPLVWGLGTFHCVTQQQPAES